MIPKVTSIITAQCTEILQIPRESYLFIIGEIGTLCSNDGSAPDHRHPSSLEFTFKGWLSPSGDLQRRRRGRLSSVHLPRRQLWQRHGSKYETRRGEKPPHSALPSSDRTAPAPRTCLLSPGHGPHAKTRPALLGKKRGTTAQLLPITPA